MCVRACVRVCMREQAVNEKKLQRTYNADDAFIAWGYFNWEEAVGQFARCSQ